MIGSTRRQSNLFFLPLAQQLHLLKDDLLDPVDELLDDEQLNERLAQALGVKRVVLPARGRLSKSRAKLQKQRWFRRGLRWRAGIEATIGTLKHPFSMERATYKGESGLKRYVGWCIITKNLVSMARTLVKRKTHAQRAA